MARAGVSLVSRAVIPVSKRVCASQVGAFIFSTLLVAPIALIGTWVMAMYANMPDTDQQMRLFFYGVLPLINGCFIVDVLLHRVICRHHVSKTATRVAAILALLLAWPVIILVGSNPASRGLPMLDERTPAPVTWWIGFAGGWLLLTLVCGGIYLVLAALARPDA